jgi:hypothetical protein
MPHSRIPAPAPSLREWKTLSDDERQRFVDTWDPNSADGNPLLKEIEIVFTATFGQLKGLTIHGIGNCHGCLVIGATHKLIFDRRLLPMRFLGLPVYCTISDIPTDFQVFESYIWAPENYQHFVERHADQIRDELGSREMSREDMLHALCGMPFSEWIEVCHGFGKEHTAL